MQSGQGEMNSTSPVSWSHCEPCFNDSLVTLSCLFPKSAQINERNEKAVRLSEKYFDLQ